MLVLWGAFLVPTAKASVVFERDGTDNGTSVMRSGINVSKIATAASTSISAIIDTVTLKLKAGSSGTNDAQFYIEVYSNATKPEEGTLIATSYSIGTTSIPTGSLPDWVNFTFETPFLLLPDSDYFYVLKSTSLDNPSLIPGADTSGGYEWSYCTGGCVGGDGWVYRGAKYALILSGKGNTITYGTGVGTTSPIYLPYGAFASTSINNLDTCVPPGSILDVGGGVAYAFCYMFVPNRAIVNQFVNLPDFIGTKQPFIYAFQIIDAFNNINLSTSSDQFYLVNIPLSSYASSTVTGVIPNISLSTTTISTYLSDSNRNALRTLLVASLYLSAFFYVFYRIMSLIRS